MTTSLFRAQKTNLVARENQPAPTILFRRDFKQHVRGVLRPGARLFVFYDAERLSEERSMRGDRPGWWITMFARFMQNGPLAQVNLWSRTGLILTGEKSTDEPGEGTMMKCDIQIPEDAQFVELWFLNSGDSGRVYYDSDYGQNYLFEFTAGRLEVLDGWLIPPDKTKQTDATNARLCVRVAAARSISAIWVNYFYWIAGVNPPVQRRTDLKPTHGDETNRMIWDNDPAPVPTGTAINFDIVFIVDGRPHLDDNSGRHYLVPSPPERDLKRRVANSV